MANPVVASTVERSTILFSSITIASEAVLAMLSIPTHTTMENMVF